MKIQGSTYLLQRHCAGIFFERITYGACVLVIGDVSYMREKSRTLGKVFKFTKGAG